MEFAGELLEKITNGFSETHYKDGGHKIGEGGFGPVFIAELHHTKVAIKLLRLKTHDDFSIRMAKDQFNTEIEVLTKYRHPNLLTLIGYSNPRGGHAFPCLVYEFMKNGSLEDALDTRIEKRRKLSYQIRLQILLDAARALVYLHMADPRCPLVHRDVKSANILLDMEYNAKVGDFGLARAVGQDGQRGKTTKVMGTSGYIAPEYLQGEISVAIDVYAFGVVLLEALTGEPSFDTSRDHGPSLVLWLQSQEPNICRVWKEHRDLYAKWPKSHAEEVSFLAAQCLEMQARQRPTMEQVLQALREIKTTKENSQVDGETLWKLHSRQPVHHPSHDQGPSVNRQELDSEEPPLSQQPTDISEADMQMYVSVDQAQQDQAGEMAYQGNFRLQPLLNGHSTHPNLPADLMSRGIAQPDSGSVRQIAYPMEESGDPGIPRGTQTSYPYSGNPRARPLERNALQPSGYARLLYGVAESDHRDFALPESHHTLGESVQGLRSSPLHFNRVSDISANAVPELNSRTELSQPSDAR